MAYNISEAMYNLRAIENLENITEDQLDDLFSGVENSYMSIEDVDVLHDEIKKDSVKRIKEIFERFEKIYDYLMSKDTFIYDTCVIYEDAEHEALDHGAVVGVGAL